MNYRYLILFLAVMTACKTTKRIKTGNVANAPSTERIGKSTTPAGSSSSPYISTVNTRYIVEDSSSVNVFMELSVDNFEASGDPMKRFATQFRVNWLLVNDYSIRERIKNGKIDIDDKSFRFDDGKVYMNFKIPRAKAINNAILITEFVDISASKKFTIDIPIDFINARFGNRFGLFKKNPNEPTFDNYVELGEPITFKAAMGYERPFYIIKYAGDNQAARSPMSTTKPSVVAFEKQRVTKYTTGQPIILTEPGLYYALEDTTKSDEGTGFYVVNNRFPRLTTATDLSEPIVYISTNTEIENVSTTDDDKKALDLFFLEMTDGNQSLAREVIRSYYRRVTSANKLFTSYKEGWKTDKGMVYIVLGPPSKVQRFKDREVWLYSQSQNFSEIIFTFYRTNNKFTDNYYELVRYPDYKQYWYPYVEAWRNGKIIE